MESARSTVYRSFLFAAIAVLVILGASLRLPVFLALAVAWAAFLGCSAAAARRGLGGLRVSREVYPSAFEEDEVGVRLVLESGKPVRRLEIADSFGAAIVSEQRMLEPGPVEPGLRRRLGYSTICSRQWGVYTVGPVQIHRSDPAGLFRATRTLPVVEEFAVFPRVYDVAGLSVLGAQRSLAPYENTAPRTGQSLLYLGVRDYRPGDDLRQIHWPATARRGSPVVQEREVDLAPYFTLFVDLDTRHRAGTGRKSTHEYLLRTAASIVWSAVRAGGFVQLAGLGRRPLHVPPGRGDHHLAFALYELIRAAQDGTTPLVDVVLGHLSSVPPGSTAVMLFGTLFVDLGPLDEVIEGFRSRGVRPVAVLVNNHSFPAISGWPPARAEILEKRREVEFFLRSRGVPLRLLEESDDLEAALGRGGFAG